MLYTHIICICCTHSTILYTRPVHMHVCFSIIHIFDHAVLLVLNTLHLRTYIRTYVTLSKYPGKACTNLNDYYVITFIDPIISVKIRPDGIPAIYQPLILQCTATIMGGINSTVDIVWTTGNTQIRRVINVTTGSNINSSTIYNDSFITPSLNLSDIGNVYECEVFINSILPTTAKTDFIVPIPGMYIAMYLHTYTFFCTICSYMFAYVTSKIKRNL